MLLTIPVDPDADTARQWAADELSKSQYAEHGPSWFERVMTWFKDLISNLFDFGNGGAGAFKAIIVVGIVAVLIILLVRLTAGPVRRAARARRTYSVFEDDHRTSAAMRAAADRAAAAGDWSLAVLERFRGIVRSLEERELLEDRPGLTADEAARAVGVRFPDVARDMAGAAEAFDGVRYGHAVVGPADDAFFRALDVRLAGRTLLSATRP